MFSKKAKEIDEEYMNDEITKIEDGDVKVVMDREEDISKKISSTNMLEKYTELGKIMFGMLKDYRKGIYTNVSLIILGDGENKSLLMDLAKQLSMHIQYNQIIYRIPA